MKMGIKEFRERLGEVARGDRPVQLTDRGQVIGTYTPWPRMTPERRQRALEGLEELRRTQERWAREGVDTDAMMAEIGLDPWGVPLKQQHDR